MQSRDTKQSVVIREVFETAARPLLADEALRLAQKRLPKLGIATVYRSVKRLLAEGWLRTVDLPGQVSRFERARAHHHHHFHCRECQQVFEIETCPDVMKSFSVPGFQIESHELTFYGLCYECRE